jgi:hypothetical protein
MLPAESPKLALGVRSAETFPLGVRSSRSKPRKITLNGDKVAPSRARPDVLQFKHELDFGKNWSLGRKLSTLLDPLQPKSQVLPLKR